MLYKRITAALVLAAGLWSSPAWAIDIDAGDYGPAPAGTNLGLLYYQYASRDSFRTVSGGKVDAGTGLDSHIGIARYIRYVDFLGLTQAPQILVPGGALTKGRLGGATLNEPSGLADPILANIVWVVNQPEKKRFLGITPFLWLPLGDYKAGRALNIGENRWKFALQAGYIESLGGGLTLDLIADTTWYGDNDKAGTGRQSLSQRNSWQFQGWLRYAVGEASHVALGYSKVTGGRQSLDRTPNGMKTEQDQLRLSAAGFVTSNVQLLGTVATDLHTRGGFQEDFRLNLRLAVVY